MQLVEREVTIPAPWGQIRGLSWGEEGAPPVLMCHGKQDVCSGFRPLVRLLPRCFRYIAIDLPGNGRSDHLPPGVQLTAMDLVPAVQVVRDHYQWDHFIYVGHSLGVVLGKIFNIAYPGHITRMVELDPVPAYETYKPKPEVLRDWYHTFYHSYYVADQYKKLNGGGEAPKYTYEKALQLVMFHRVLKKEAAEFILERSLEPAGNSLFRFTHDQRMRQITRYPLSGDAFRAIYTSSRTPTFCVLAQMQVDLGAYDQTAFIMDPKCWPHGNFSVKIVEGAHDVHISNPEVMADDISAFLMKDVKARL